jgi:hypothetical protein
LTNPFAGIDEAMRGSVHFDRFSGRMMIDHGDLWDSRVFSFLFIWAGVATLLCIPWMVRQTRLFRPLERPEREVPAVEPLPVVEPVPDEPALPVPAESQNGEPVAEPRPEPAPRGAFREADR